MCWCPASESLAHCLVQGSSVQPLSRPTVTEPQHCWRICRRCGPSLGQDLGIGHIKHGCGVRMCLCTHAGWLPHQWESIPCCRCCRPASERISPCPVQPLVHPLRGLAHSPLSCYDCSHTHLQILGLVLGTACELRSTGPFFVDRHAL